MERKTDWKAVYDSLNNDFAEYGSTYSNEIYDRIISKCDLLIESSPEFRDAALMSKSSILAYSNQYDEAVKVAEQIPDTASIVNSFRSKTVHINSLLSSKAENHGDEVSARMYNDKVILELEEWISARKDSLYHALMYQPMEVPDVQDYKYSGKELVDYANLGWYDYGARYYDPVLMRWHSADLLLEKYYSTSPYAFCSNNFVNFVDPDGKDIYCFSQGVYWGKSECGGTHRIANITYDSKGNTTYTFYDFADSENDPASIESGDITEIKFISQDTVVAMLDNQGAFDFNGNILDFAKVSASDRGSTTSNFDYTYSELYNKYKGYKDDTGLAKSPYL